MEKMNHLLKMLRTQRPARLRLSARFAAALAAVLILASCGGNAPTAAPDVAPSAQPTTPATGGMEEIKIAIMAPITGDAASVGAEQLNFARLAVENFNAEHNMNIQMIESDTELDPAKAIDLAQRLVEDEAIYAIVAPAGSQIVEAVAPVVASNSLALISPSATRPDLTEQGHKHLFRVVPRDDVQGPSNANFIIDQLGARQVWIIDDQSSYATGLADEAEQVFQAKGIASVRESISQDDADFSALVTRLKADAPDVTFIPFQLASQAALFARQMDEQGVESTIVGGDGLFFVEDFIEAAAGAAEGSYVSFFAPDVSMVEAALPIVEAYKAEHGEIGPFGASAYAAVMVALEAIQRAYEAGNFSREAVLAEIAATYQPDSILGIPIAFDAKGDILNASFFLFQVKDGAFTPVQ
jgi:branched-chain amino acid transport system substrate-binding protein